MTSTCEPFCGKETMRLNSHFAVETLITNSLLNMNGNENFDNTAELSEDTNEKNHINNSTMSDSFSWKSISRPEPNELSNISKSFTFCEDGESAIDLKSAPSSK